tara:strand:- start:360 stop:845 length:486 start_codon:yes stop_codon:yes gene_type:complete
MNVDKKTFYFGGAAAGSLILMMAVQGCDLQKMIKFDVPPGIQSSVGISEEESMSNAEYVWNQWQSWVNTNSEKLASNIEDSKSRLAMIENLTSMGMGALGEVSGSFPGGAVMFSGLSLLTGWFLKRPGEDKEVAKQKQNSYNAGLVKGKEIVDKIKEASNA